MSEIPFHQTRMGHAFLEGTMPGLVRELARLNANLERYLALAEGQGGSAAPSAPSASKSSEEER